MRSRSTLSVWVQTLKLGRLAYWCWYLPLGIVRKSIAEGGPLRQWTDARARARMARAAAVLPVSNAPAAPLLPELHFLTGKRFWDQTAFCLFSLQAQAHTTFRTVFHDDGSFDPPTIDRLRMLFPSAEIRLRAENDARLNEFLPPSRYPFLQERRKNYPNILKLTDPHVGRSGWQLVLDSDMLFFRRPDFLLDWLTHPLHPLHMVDIEDSYGYPLPLMESLAGAPIPRLVNVGLTGLQSNSLDWDQLEFWCRRLTESHGTSYYLEQGLAAMLFAGHTCAVAPRQDYLLAPDESECRAPQAVLHHYVGLSKRGYFRYAWQAAFARAQQPPVHALS